MYKLMKSTISGLFLISVLSGTYTFADKTAELTGLVSGENISPVVIKGKIRSIDLYKMEIVLEGCALLGNRPLKLSGETSYYIGVDEDTINSARGGTRFSECDKLNYYDLEVGNTIKCNYEIIDGEFWALRVIRISPHVQRILFLTDLCG